MTNQTNFSLERDVRSFKNGPVVGNNKISMPSNKQISLPRNKNGQVVGNKKITKPMNKQISIPRNNKIAMGRTNKMHGNSIL